MNEIPYISMTCSCGAAINAPDHASKTIARWMTTHEVCLDKSTSEPMVWVRTPVYPNNQSPLATDEEIDNHLKFLSE